jgi:hypothetical protein
MIVSSGPFETIVVQGSLQGLVSDEAFFLAAQEHVPLFIAPGLPGRA